MIKLFDNLFDSVIFRIDKIIDCCKGKTVLHLGFVQHDEYKQKIEQGLWLHSQIVEVALRVVGVDYLSKPVEELKANYGYEAYICDVMRLSDLPLNETFDVIVCGELIEHLENPGLMLDGIKRFMGPESVLVITTPNPWCSNRINLIKKGASENSWLNTEHAVWFSFQTLKQILERLVYKPIVCDYYYGEMRTNYLEGTETRFKGPVRLCRRFLQVLMTKKPQYGGLFFIANR